MHTPFKRDVCAELAKAAHDAGIKLGWYFSPMDWRDPDCRSTNNAAFVKRMQAELEELLTHYGKIDILWFDWDAKPAPWDQETTCRLVRKLQPGLVIDDRLDKPGDSGLIGPWADFYTPEQEVGGFDNQRPWESCMTLSRRNQWAWGGSQDGVKTFAECLNMLVRCAGGDGNMLLNVGPMPTGEIAPEQAGRLKEMGAWLAKYGSSIYGTRGGPFKPVAVGRAVIEQAYPELKRVRAFAIECWQDGEWKSCYCGVNLGATLEAGFEPVTAQRVRLNITEATDGPTIWDFELFPPKK